MRDIGGNDLLSIGSYARTMGHSAGLTRLEMAACRNPDLLTNEMPFNPKSCVLEPRRILNRHID
jgi:hypothetical protein